MKYLSISLLVFVFSCHQSNDLLPNTINDVDTSGSKKNCLVIKEIYKSSVASRQDQKVDQIVVDGILFDLYFQKEVEYEYDSKQRLIKQKSIGSMVFTPQVEYIYYKNEIITKLLSSGGVSSVDTVRLNANGYDDRYEYDADGHQTNIKGSTPMYNRMWKNGNLLRDYIIRPDFGAIKQTMEYDTTLISIPNPISFNGKGSSNLRKKEIKESTQASALPNEVLMTSAQYTYEFNKDKTVKRKILYNKAIFTSYLGGEGFNTGISIVEYTYECK